MEAPEDDSFELVLPGRPCWWVFQGEMTGDGSPPPAVILESRETLVTLLGVGVLRSPWRSLSAGVTAAEGELLDVGVDVDAAAAVDEVVEEG